MPQEKCPKCKGTGKIIFPYLDSIIDGPSCAFLECSTCKGTGKIEKK